MINIFYGKIIRSLTKEVSALRAQVAVLTDISTTHASQTQAERSVSEARASGVTHLTGRVATLEQTVAAQAQTVRTQNETLRAQSHSLIEQSAAIELLREESQRRTEEIRQARADFVRLERQAAIDLDEMRQTSSAVAAALFSKPGASTDAEQITPNTRISLETREPRC